MKKILVVDDEDNIRSALAFALKREGYAVVGAANGTEALRLAKAEQPDLVLLDRMLPEIDGVEVCRQLRSSSSVPIIMVTAKASELDTVVGLEVGADDYVSKPFSMNILLARIKALLRRSEHDAAGPTDAVSLAGLTLSPHRYTAEFQGLDLGLTPKLFELLLVFVRNPGRVFTRDELLTRVWDTDFGGGTRTVDVHVNWLRKRLAAVPGSPLAIHTVRGVGYKLVVEAR
jgi:DNA-binding response OmpR family regulator